MTFDTVLMKQGKQCSWLKPVNIVNYGKANTLNTAD